MAAALQRAVLRDEKEEVRRDSVVVHPGSGGRGKNHGPGFWVSLLKILERFPGFSGFTIRILLGPAEESVYPRFRAHADSGRAQIDNCPDPEGLSALLSEASLYIGHDSGVSHLAAMLGTPTIALFKSTDPVQWRPLGPFVRIIPPRDENTQLQEQVLDAAVALIGRCFN
jgi:ADP-heptose:LPS heptosyltransferase